MKKILYILFVIFPLLAFAQELHYDQYTTDDGLPSNTVYEIVQDSNGLLWMGTENGLVSYDGITFERFTNSRLKDNDIIELEISKDGHVTFGNVSNQYCRLEKQKVVIVDVAFDTYMVLRSTKYNDYLYEAHEEREIYKYENGGIKASVKTSANLNIESAVAIDFDSLGNTILYHRHDGTKVSKIDANLKRLNVSAIEANHSGVSKGKSKNDYYVWRAREIWSIDSSLFININCAKFRNILRVKSKSIVLTSEGALIYEPTLGIVDTFLQKYELNFGFEDQEGNLWLSTTNDGLLKVYISDIIVLPNLSEGTDIIEVKPIGENLYTLTFSDIAFYNAKNNLIKSFKFKSKYFKTAIVLSNLVYVFENKKVYVFDFNGERKFSFQNGKISQYVYKVSSMIGGQIYLASRNAIFRLDEQDSLKPNIFQRCLVINQIYRANAITGLNSTGVIYVGSDSGLHQFYENDYTPRLVMGALRAKNINCLSVYDDKSLWIGTSNNGLYRLGSDDEMDSLNIFKCIGTNVINDVVQFENFVFVATPSGIVRYDLNTKNCDILNEYRGLFSNTVNKILVKSLDSIFLTQDNELIMVKNSLFDKISVSPTLVLENIYVNNTYHKAKNEELIFSHEDNNFEFQFDFYTYRNVGDKMMQYRFGVDSLWITSNDLTLRFPSLKPNDYKLEVRGMFSSTEYTNTRTFEFTILPPWWQTTWSMFLGLGAIVLSIYLIVVIRDNRVERHEAIKRENLELSEASRREYLQQINKVKDQALQLQMNPHFIFNAMNAIQNFITSDREKDATIYLAKFAKLIRLIFEYSNSNLITMEAELEFVRLYIDLEQLRFGSRLTCTLIVNESIENEKDLLRVPPLLIQPIIENSFKHGLFHKLEGGEVNISYDLKGDTIVTVVEDNGIGRNASIAMQNARPNEDRHSGLKNIMQRLEIFSCNMPNHENSMLMEDLFCEGKPCGTRTTIKVTIDENK